MRVYQYVDKTCKKGDTWGRFYRSTTEHNHHNNHNNLQEPRDELVGSWSSDPQDLWRSSTRQLPIRSSIVLLLESTYDPDWASEAQAGHTADHLTSPRAHPPMRGLCSPVPTAAALTLASQQKHKGSRDMLMLCIWVAGHGRGNAAMDWSAGPPADGGVRRRPRHKSCGSLDHDPTSSSLGSCTSPKPARDLPNTHF
jgi:hypothetical protein